MKSSGEINGNTFLQCGSGVTIAGRYVGCGVISVGSTNIGVDPPLPRCRLVLLLIAERPADAVTRTACDNINVSVSLFDNGKILHALWICRFAAMVASQWVRLEITKRKYLPQRAAWR